MAPKDAYTLILGICEYVVTLQDRKNAANVIKVKDLEMGKLSWVIQLAQSNHRNPEES